MSLTTPYEAVRIKDYYREEPLRGKYILNPVIDDVDESVCLAYMSGRLGSEHGVTWIWDNEYEIVNSEDVDLTQVIIDNRKATETTEPKENNMGPDPTPQPKGFIITIQTGTDPEELFNVMEVIRDGLGLDDVTVTAR